MPIRLHAFTLPAALGLALSACSHGPKETPIAVVESLYSTEMFAPMRGLPSTAQAIQVSETKAHSTRPLYHVRM